MFRLYFGIGLFLVIAGQFAAIKYLWWSADRYKGQAEQNKAQLSMCVNDYNLGQDIINEYQNNIDDLSRRYNSISVQHGQRCATITGSTGSSDEATARKPIQKDGVPVGRLLDFAQGCERIRLQLNACQGWVNGRQ